MSVTTAIVEELDDETAEALARLLPQVSTSAVPLTRERVETVLAESSTHIVAARIHGATVGMALLCVCTTLKGQFGLVEEVAVDEAARGSHVGVHLMVELLEHAERLGLGFVELTSRPSREAANGLYISLGFELRSTNVYRHGLAAIPALR